VASGGGPGEHGLPAVLVDQQPRRRDPEPPRNRLDEQQAANTLLAGDLHAVPNQKPKEKEEKENEENGGEKEV
jgi:hypothetical protein